MLHALDSFQQSIDRAGLLKGPFPVLLFSDVFPRASYEAMLQEIPQPEFFTELAHPDAVRDDGTSTRRVFELNRKNCEALPASLKSTWGDLAAVLYSGECQRILFKRMAPILAAERGISLAAAANMTAYPRCAITEDSPGFRIGAHPDWHTKLLTVQFYLADGLGSQGLGTHFLENPQTPWFTAPYRPNGGYAFVVSSRSWHARDTLPALTRKRYTLALTYFIEPPVEYSAEEYGSAKARP